MKKVYIKFCTLTEVLKLNFHPYNREHKRSHINKLKKGMLKDLENFPAVQVNTTTMNITDGNGRTQAYLELMKEGKLPKDSQLKVEFITIPAEDEYRLMIVENNNVAKWTLKNHCDSEIAMGNENYIRLKELSERHVVTKMGDFGAKMRNSWSALNGKTGATSSLKNRTFTCTEDDIKWGDKVLEEVEEIATIIGLPFNGQYMERFIASWSKNRKKDDIPFDKFVVAANKIKPREYTFNVPDWDRYYRELMGYMVGEKFKKEYERYKRKTKKVA